jgi:hypothetical protein
MLTKHLSLTFSMVWTIVISNIIIVAVSLLFINKIANMTTIRGALLIPFILLLAFIGSYTANNHLGDLVVTLIFGGLGYFMVRLAGPTSLILGFILGSSPRPTSYLHDPARSRLAAAAEGDDHLLHRYRRRPHPFSRGGDYRERRPSHEG